METTDEDKRIELLSAAILALSKAMTNRESHYFYIDGQGSMVCRDCGIDYEQSEKCFCAVEATVVDWSEYEL
jgi:hypothetical protein